MPEDKSALNEAKELGNITVSKEVVATIAALETIKNKGVAGIASGYKGKSANILPKNEFAKGLEVWMNAGETMKMIDQIRQIESGFGTGIKEPGATERQSSAWARKSLVATCDILPGEVITRERVAFKRPGTGIAPSEVEKVFGRRARVAIKRDSLILWEQLD